MANRELLPYSLWRFLAAVAASMLGCVILPAEAQHPIVPPALDSPPADPALAEVDDVLNMDLETLSRTSVRDSATESNPVVEGVSKKAETLSESPGIVDVITAKDIEEFGAKNLYEVLQRATSVFMTGSFLFPRNVASIRGNLQNHEDNHVLVLINGRPFRDVTLGGVNVSVYTAFPIHTIDHVEVIRGPGSVLYGTNAFNGVINIVTKSPDKPTLYASNLAGSYEWQSYSLAAGNGDEDREFYVGATQSRQHGWPFTATSEPPYSTETNPWGEDNIGVFSSYRYRGFTANLFAARATEEMIGPDGQYPSDRLDDPRVFLDLGYFHELDDWHSVTVNFTYNYDGTVFPSVIPGVSFFAPSHSFLLEGNYRAQITDSFDVLVGGITDFHRGVARMGAFDPIPQYRETWYGVYFQFEHQTTEWLKLVGGMQANMPGDVQAGIVPRAAAIASLSENWTGKFLYGQAFRSPYQAERSILIPGLLMGNPNLIPETIQTFDVQLAYHTDSFRAAATYFHSDFFDIITRVGFPQVYVNSGRMKFEGVELENDWTLTDRLRVLGSTTYQTNERDGVADTTSVPNWMAKMGVAYTDRGITLGLFDTYFGDQIVPATAVPVNADPDAYHLVSLNTLADLDQRFGWNTGRKMQVQFMIQNLLDEDINHVEFEREQINSLPAGPGRTFYGGFTYAY